MRRKNYHQLSRRYFKVLNIPPLCLHWGKIQMAENLLLKVLCLEIPSNSFEIWLSYNQKGIKINKRKICPKSTQKKVTIKCYHKSPIVISLDWNSHRVVSKFYYNTRKLLMFTPNTKRAMPAHESENVHTLQRTPLLEGLLLLLLSRFSRVQLCATP